MPYKFNPLLSAGMDYYEAGGSPGGATTQVQINDGGAFYGNSGFVYLKASGFVGIGQSTPLTRLHIEGGQQFIHSGADTIGQLYVKGIADEAWIVSDADSNSNASGFVTSKLGVPQWFIYSPGSPNQADLYFYHGGVRLALEDDGTVKFGTIGNARVTPDSEYTNNGNGSGGANERFGVNALKALINGNYNSAFSFNSQRFNESGSRDNSFGFQSLYAAIDANYCNAFGNSALTSVVHSVSMSGFGDLAGYSASGNRGTFLGAESDVVTGGLDDVTAVGYHAKVDQAHAMLLGDIADTALAVLIGVNKFTSNSQGATLYAKAHGSLIAATFEGKISLFDGSTYSTIFQLGSQAANLTYTLPIAYPGSSGYALVSTTGGVMSWAVIPGATAASGGDGDVQFATSSGFDSASAFNWNDAGQYLAIPELHLTGTLLAPVYGGTGIDTSASSGVPYIAAGSWGVQTPLADGNYVIVTGLTQNGSITITNGVVTAVTPVI